MKTISVVLATLIVCVAGCTSVVSSDDSMEKQPKKLPISPIDAEYLSYTKPGNLNLSKPGHKEYVEHVVSMIENGLVSREGVENLARLNKGVAPILLGAYSKYLKLNNYQDAVGSYRKEALQGDSMAQLNLGLAHANGQGIPQNNVLAYMLFSLAATGGDRRAINYRDIIQSVMTPSEIAKGQELAANWKPGTPLPTRY